VQSTKHTPAAANTANRLQGRGVLIAPQKNGNRAPQTCHPSHKAPTQPPDPATKQAHAKQIIAQKQGNVAKKVNSAAKLRSVCAEDHKRAVKVYKRDRCQKENQE